MHITNGSLVLTEKGRSYGFTPQTHHVSLPRVLAVTLGSQTKGTLTIGGAKTRPHPFPTLPVRLRKIAGIGYTVGPFIAILTSDGGSSFHGNRHNFADIIRMGRKMGVAIFVVTPSSFQSEDSSVIGYVLDPSVKGIHWHKTRLPMPNAIYNRIPTRKAEQSSAVQEFFKDLSSHYRIPIFNPTFFNKWQLYRLLAQSPQLKNFVPESVQLGKPITLQKMILRHPTLYLKPIDGKAGIGMMRMTHLSRGFELIYQTADAKQKYTFSNFSDLWKKISHLKKQAAYVIQKAIPLAQYQGSPFDLRMLLQKDEYGEWDVTGIGIRIAGKTAISTHVPQGGRIELADKVFNEVFTNSKEKILRYVKDVGLKVAHYIEENQSGKLGEMSIDWGLDQYGDAWFFEANSKPMKFDEPHIRTLSLQRIIHYGLYLSGYKEVATNGTKNLYS